jgi:peptide/nickel transport system substrate-binding protein
MSRKTLNRRDFLRLSGLAAAGALITSCAPKAPETAGQTEATLAPVIDQPAATAVPATATPLPLPEAAPGVPGVAREDTLIFAFSYGTPLDVNQNLGFMTSQQGNACVLEPLYFYNPHDGVNPLVPWIADGPYEYSDDYKELTVYIKKGVEWSDGTPFTAHDVVYTINFNNSQADAGFPVIPNGGQLRNNFEEAVAPDDFTVVLKSRDGKPNPRMHRWLCSSFDVGLSILPKHLYESLDPETVNELPFIEDTKFTGVVTAPFISVYNTPEKRIYDRRDDWWGVKTGFAELPEVKRIIVLPSSTDQTVLAQQYAKNELDTSLSPLVSSHRSIIDANPHLTTWTGRQMPMGNVDHWPNLLWMNCDDPLFSDRDVRWAISYAINTDQLVQNIWQGMGIPSQIPFSLFGIFQPYIDAIEPLLKTYPVGVQDLSKTDELMTKAGWAKNSEGFWAKGGEVFQPNWGGFNALYADVGPALCEQLVKAGFKVDYKEDPQMWSGNIQTGVLNMYTFGIACDTDVYESLEYFHSRHFAPTGEFLPLEAWNARWTNEEYDELCDEMAVMNPPDDQTRYTDLVVKAMEIWYRELPAIPVWQWMHYVPMNTTYWKNWPTQDNPYGVPALWLRNGGFPVPMHLRKA